MNTLIELKGMRFYAYHGVSPQETKVGNNFIIDILYALPLQDVFSTDELEDTISYAAIYEYIKQEMTISSKLLETVAARIIRVLKEHFDQLTYLKIKLTKLNPPIEGEVYSAAVIMEQRW
ncbi:MAG: dihydroneopterin aldolase [Tannerella sp.]|jgi:dihydroneopterin aldolase|nr:dihydroneopterin aldolase [Tannerella sp.]